MNIKKIKELVELMNENDLTEVEVELEGIKVKLVKKTHGVVEQVIAPVAPVAPVVPVAQKETEASVSKGRAKEVKAPMVGTFYRAPAPDADAYVEVGDIVKKGDVICIVEAMKLMNEIKAEFGGKIVEICVENAEAVEFGQVMCLIEPV